MNELFLQAPALTKQIMRSYYCARDVEEFLSHQAEDLTWIGLGENEYKLIYTDIEAYFRHGETKIPCCNILDDEYHVVYSSGDTCVVMGKLRVNTDSETGLLIEVHQRVTFVYKAEGEQLRIKHMHFSIPYSDMKDEEYFPNKVGAQNYEYLQRMLDEKIEMIEMMIGTMRSGLKGSLDDEAYTYFYVNEGLTKMLGYTYEEFMAKSGGTAAGAVYPPDLPGALADCKRCFAEGNEYSTEYRMEKKDGSLLWVMDTGRKIKNPDGLTVINSIITDITPFKTTLAELKIEQERYRIALENITDIIFEYDIREDVFLMFEKVATHSDSKMERYEISNFRGMLEEKGFVHRDDIGAMLDVFTGRMPRTVEVRMKHFLRPMDDWEWKNVKCSVLYDDDHRPMRTIGTLRDITEEKEKEQKLLERAEKDPLTGLLNTSAAQSCVHQYIAEKHKMERYALLVIDLDKFKQVNDTFGHLAGNAVLIQTAICLKHACRGTDIVSRIGGDEFLVALKDITVRHALQKGEEIKDAVRAMHFDEYEELAVSCSIGVALSSEGCDLYDEVFKKADEALYYAKKKGKNCVGCLEPSES